MRLPLASSSIRAPLSLQGRQAEESLIFLNDVFQNHYRSLKIVNARLNNITARLKIITAQLPLTWQKERSEICQTLLQRTTIQHFASTCAWGI